MKVIMVHPAYDEVTITLSGWADRALENLSITDDLRAELAMETNLRLCLETNRTTELISFYGHGSQDFLIGNSTVPSSPERVISTSKPGVLPTELKGRKLYVVACHAGAKLGPSLATAGCTFIGYNMQFSYTKDFVGDFEEVVNQGLIEWATLGKTSTEVLEQLKTAWSALRHDYSLGARKTAKNAFMAALSAHWNQACVCCIDS
jgi:hypothetical protein